MGAFLWSGGHLAKSRTYGLRKSTFCTSRNVPNCSPKGLRQVWLPLFLLLCQHLILCDLFIYSFWSGKSVCNYVENCQTVLHGGCTILHSHPKWVRVHVVCILISNGLMTWDFEHFFIYLFTICISSLVLSVQIFCPVFN